MKIQKDYKLNSEQNDISTNSHNESVSYRVKYNRQNSLKNRQVNNDSHRISNKKIDDKNSIQDTICINNREECILDSLTCKSYIVYRSSDNKILGGSKFNKELEIASLTKMMTLYVCLLLVDRLQRQPETIYIRVSQKAADLSNYNMIYDI